MYRFYRILSRIAALQRVPRWPVRPTDISSVTHLNRSLYLNRSVCTNTGPVKDGQGSDRIEKPKMFMVYTCGKCDTRSAKSFTKDAYEKGVVIVTCGKCQARHVIADNLGWFGEEKNVEEILAKKGYKVGKITDEDIDFSS